MRHERGVLTYLALAADEKGACESVAPALEGRLVEDVTASPRGERTVLLSAHRERRERKAPAGDGGAS